MKRDSAGNAKIVNKVQCNKKAV